VQEETNGRTAANHSTGILMMRFLGGVEVVSPPGLEKDGTTNQLFGGRGMAMASTVLKQSL